MTVDTSLPDSAALYEAAACGLVLTSLDGTIRRINATFKNWLGYSDEDLVGVQRIQGLLTMGGRIFHQTHLAPLLKMQGSVAEVKLDVTHHDGHALPMMLNIILKEHDGHQFQHISLTVATDRHKYEQELLLARQNAEQALESQLQAQETLEATQRDLEVLRAAAEDRALFAEQMIGIVSHDLRNPLNAILLASQMLERASLGEDQQRLASRITKSGLRANRLIAELLDFSAARLGRGFILNKQAKDPIDFIAESIEELSIAFPGRELRCAGGHHGLWEFDADRISQVLGNLVANAVAYGAPDSPITITALIKEGNLTIGVHNFGPVISADILPAMFQPMMRGNDVQGDSRSIGLGLYIVREIAVAHGGEVTVTSTADQGTVFYIELPGRVTDGKASEPIL